MANWMNRPKRVWMLGILALGVFSMAHASDDTTQKQLLKIGTPKTRDDFYVKIDSGAVFFHPPSKDNSNFSEAGNPPNLISTTDGVTSIGTQSGDTTTWSLGGTFGYYLPVEQPEPWLGTNLRVEASGDYFEARTTGGSNISISPAGNFLNVGRLDGNYLGGNSSTDVGSISAGSNPVASEGLITRDEFYQAGAAFRSDYIFFNRFVLSPRLGFQYSHLDQNFETTASGNRGSIYQSEDIGTDYFGPTFGLELKVQLSRVLVYYLQGDISPLYATTDYEGNQNGISTRFGGGSGTNSVNDSHDTFSFKGGAETGFYFDCGPVKLKVGAGFEYWNYVASVQEASLPAGTDSISVAVPSPPPLPAHSPFTVQPSHLVSTDMLNPDLKLSVIIPF